LSELRLKLGSYLCTNPNGKQWRLAIVVSPVFITFAAFAARATILPRLADQRAECEARVGHEVGHRAPATGAIGSSVRIDYINQFGPTNAWVTLDTVTLTSSPQLYFDLTMFRQPTRLYRLVAVP
jgi:hypothetical protein